MFKRVLVPMDGSARTERVLHHLVQLARWCGSELTLLHVLRPAPSRPSGDLQVEYPDVVTDRAQSLAREYFAEIVGQLGEAGVPARSTTATGELVDTVVARAAAGGFDLLALGVDDRRPIIRKFVESAGEQIRVRSPIPMLILNGKLEEQEGRPGETLGRLLVTLDGTRVSEFALPYVRRLARAGNIPITLMRVVPDIPAYFPSIDTTRAAPRFFKASKREADDYLERHATLLAEAGHDVKTRVAEGNVARAIVEEQIARPGELLVMASTLRRGWQRAALRCTADEVVRLSPRPVLLIPAGRRPDQEIDGDEDEAAPPTAPTMP